MAQYMSTFSLNSTDESPAEAAANTAWKVPIPRARALSVTEASTPRSRVPHACQSCRQKKTKCDGERPRCSSCEDQGKECHYEDKKREVTVKKIKELEDKVRRYENLLCRLRPVVDSASQQAIDEALHAHSTSSTTPRSQTNCQNSFSPAMTHVMETEDVSGPREDINAMSVTSPSGFMGPATDVSMLQDLIDKLYINAGSTAPSPQRVRPGQRWDTPGNSLDLSSTYQLDDTDISMARTPVDFYAMPPKELGNMFVEAYFRTVHPLFPVTFEPEFMQQYERQYDPQDCSEVSDKTLAGLNLVLAIGARHYNLLGIVGKEPWQHLDFFRRARILGALDGGVLFEIPTLADVQNLVLIGMYLLAARHTNRAWNATGLAVRLSYGLGLHLHDVSSNMTAHQKEMRIRVWYSIYYLETTMCITTGRPSALREQDNIAHVSRSPEPGLQADRAPDVYYNSLIELSGLQSDILSELYPRRSVSIKADIRLIRHTIETLNERLEEWSSKLPTELQLDNDNESRADHVIQRTDLILRYENAKLLIFRPCLYPSVKWIDHQAPGFIRQAAVSCVDAARSIIKVIVNDERHMIENIKRQPWWCLLHYLVLAQAIMMLEIVFQEAYSTDSDEGQELLEDTQSVLRWLECVSQTDLAAKRALAQLSSLSEYVVATVGKKPNTATILLDTEMRDDDLSTDPSSIFSQHSWLLQDVSSFLDENQIYEFINWENPL